MKKIFVIFFVTAVFFVAYIPFAEAQSPLVLNGYQLNANQAKWVEYIAKEVVPLVGPDVAARVTWWTLKEGELGLDNPFGYSNCGTGGGNTPLRMTEECPDGYAWQVGIASVQVPGRSLNAVEAEARKRHPEMSIDEILAQVAELAKYSNKNSIVNSTGRVRTSLILRDPATGFVFEDEAVLRECVNSWSRDCTRWWDPNDKVATDQNTAKSVISALTNYYKNFSTRATPPSPSEEQGEQKEVPLGLPQQISNFYAFALGIGALIALGVLIFGGILYTTSAGNASRQDDAKQWIAGSFIGLALLFGSWFILNTINPELTKLTDLKLLANKATGGLLDDSSGTSPCTPGTTATGGATVIVLDPGHGINETITDPATGLNDSDSSNETERKAVWNVAQKVKARLEAAGYKVILTKSSEGARATLRTRADIADSNNAALAVSIHGDPGLGNHGEIYVQKDDLYRGGSPSPHEKVTFNNSAVAAKSQAAAQIFQQKRSEIEDGSVVIKDNSFNGRYPPVEPGNIPFILLVSKTPWVYNELKMPFNEDTYANSIVESVKGAVPLGTTGTTSSGSCATAGAERVAQIATAEYNASVQEEPLGSNKGPKVSGYLDAVNAGPVNPWCAAFVSWTFQQAGYSFSCASAAAKELLKCGSTVSSPAVGNIAVFRTDDSDFNNDHAGIVTEVRSDGSYVVINGNGCDERGCDRVARDIVTPSSPQPKLVSVPEISR